MNEPEDFTQVTFYYENGHVESFFIPIASQDLAQQMNMLLEKAWLTFHLIDQTVFISTYKVIKVEIKPPLSNYGIGVFPNSQRVTALARGTR